MVSKAAGINADQFSMLKRAIADSGAGWTCGKCVIVVSATQSSGELVGLCPKCDQHRSDAGIEGFSQEPVLEDAPDERPLTKKTAEQLEKSQQQRRENQARRRSSYGQDDAEQKATRLPGSVLADTTI